MLLRCETINLMEGPMYQQLLHLKSQLLHKSILVLNREKIILEGPATKAESKSLPLNQIFEEDMSNHQG